MNNLIILNKNDNVAVTPFVISPQTKIESQGIVSVDPIFLIYPLLLISNIHS